MGLEKLSSNVWSHYLKIYVWLEGRALYRLRHNSRKISCDYYIDDRMLLPENAKA